MTPLDITIKNNEEQGTKTESMAMRNPLMLCHTTFAKRRIRGKNMKNGEYSSRRPPLALLCDWY